MATRKASTKKTLWGLTREFLSPEQLETYVAELHGASDRTCALVGGAAVEQALLLLIQNRLVPEAQEEESIRKIFYEPNAVLGDFSARTEVGFAFGLIDRHVKDDLDIIRRVRNAFAHRVQPLEFNAPLIATECMKLKAYESVGAAGTFTRNDSPRSLFIASSLKLQGDLMQAARRGR